jgi:predicted tellurium resistance membrane protein TerC
MLGLIIFAVALVVVLVTSLFKNVDMNDKIKNLIAVVLSVIGGGLTAWGGQAGDFSSFEAGDVISLVLIIYGASQAIYQFILKGTRVEAELATTSPFGGRDEV